MPADQARRGRPKGSGLDDTAHLQKVARMLEADPELKPTTAIKAIGISDPSTIRRLRDKLRGTSAADEQGPSRSGIPERVNGGETRRLGGAVSAARRLVCTFSTSRETPPKIERAAEAQLKMPAPRETRNEAQVSWLQAWCGFGLYAFTTTVEAQMAMFESLLSVPQIASAIRQQALFNEQVLAFYSYGTDVRATLH